MLRSIKQLYGSKLAALDGEIGHVKDFYFGDWSWTVRYVVVETGSWLTGRQVLLSHHSLGRLVLVRKDLRVNLTRKQIEDSPPMESRLPVSRQYEEAYNAYYGWPNYWQGDAMWGMAGVPMPPLPSNLSPNPPVPADSARFERSEANLRSTQAVTGYHLQATDGTLGHVCDFMMDDESWTIGQIVIKTGHRFSGKEVQIPMKKIERISYEESRVYVNLTSDAVEQSPAHYAAATAEVI